MENKNKMSDDHLDQRTSSHPKILGIRCERMTTTGSSLATFLFIAAKDLHVSESFLSFAEKDQNIT